MDSRAVAAVIIATVLQERITLDEAFTISLSDSANTKDKAFTRELSYGVLRWFYMLDFIFNAFVSKPVRKKDIVIKTLALCGLYQMEFMRTPEHAAISATVEASNSLKKPWARQLINAVLRRYQRESKQIKESIMHAETAFYAHPQWLINAIKRDWPRYWQQILTANNQKPPMFLRVNQQNISVDGYLQKLVENSIEAVPVNDCQTCIRVIEPVDVEELPGFETGMVSVQDLGAQYAAVLLDLKPGMRVLDACAAPGGKSAHILETEPEVSVLDAIDVEPARIKKLRDTANRTGVKMNIKQADIREVPTWWEGIEYDRILLDAPCSASGVIRRHPDIKVLRTPEMVVDSGKLEYEILESVWPTLKRGGKLIYSTCSILAEENDRQIDSFLKKYSDAVNMDIMSSWGIKTEFGIQTVPGVSVINGAAVTPDKAENRLYDLDLAVQCKGKAQRL